MNETNFARRIVARLDRELAALPPGIAEKLARARRRALDRRASAPVRGRLGAWSIDQRLVFRLALPAIFAVVTVGMLIYLQNVSTPDPLDIEIALLADELPIHAYTDPGFDAWLSRTSYEPQQ